MSLNWNFERGGGSNQKTLRGGSMDIFWNNIIPKNINAIIL